MTRQRKLYWAKTGVILCAIPVAIYAHIIGPDAGKNGVPGESICAESGCHVGTAVNGGKGSVSIAFPGAMTYTPGVKQHLTVTIADSAQRVYGFQLTARLSSNAKTQAGSFASSDHFTTVMCASTNLFTETELPFGGAQNCPAAQPLSYIEHDRDGGTHMTTAGSFSYAVDWTPPSSDAGSVVLYVAGNAGNGDGTERGDHIYTATYTLTASAGGGTKPAITSGQIRNPSDSTSAGIAGGGFVQIKGANLANIGAAGRTWTGADFGAGNTLPTSLDGTSVTIDGKAAYVYFISPTQVNAIMPLDSNQGPVNVVVTNNGQASDPQTVTLQPFAPAFFMYNGTWAVATRNSDGAVIGDPARVPGTVPAKPGDVLILWGTGFGATSPAFPDGGVPTAGAAATTQPSILIGGVTPSYAATVISAYAGLYQVGVVVPNISDGDQPVIATSGGFTSRPDVTIYVKH